MKIRHISVAERIIRRWERADCDRCIARFRSFYNVRFKMMIF